MVLCPRLIISCLLADFFLNCAATKTNDRLQNDTVADRRQYFGSLCPDPDPDLVGSAKYFLVIRIRFSPSQPDPDIYFMFSKKISGSRIIFLPNLRHFELEDPDPHAKLPDNTRYTQ